MRTIISKIVGILPVFFPLFIFQAQCLAQMNNRAITTYQFRHVPDDKIEEFLKRETTYWSKVAQKAVDNKLLTFWALLEKVGGDNINNAPNYLFINTYTDIDKAGDVWSNPEATTGMKMADIETNSLGATTGQFFLHDENWAQAKNAVPEKDFNYVVMVYHDTNYPDSLIHLEKTYWSPFIQTAMDNGQTSQRAWGNAVVLTPTGPNIKFTTVSYDLYKTLGDALMQDWKPNTVFPTDGLNKIGSIETSRRDISVYHVVKVVAAPAPN
jgi:hypothetical protein